MIEKIRIKNYRGIKSLEINNLKKYNFFIGNNGSSKTTSLEAIFSAIPNDGNAIVIMANSRGMQVKLNNNNSFFYNSNISDDIEFTQIIIMNLYTIFQYLKRIIKHFTKVTLE